LAFSRGCPNLVAVRGFADSHVHVMVSDDEHNGLVPLLWFMNDWREGGLQLRLPVAFTPGEINWHFVLNTNANVRRA
jgi:hypothetical protein